MNSLEDLRTAFQHHESGLTAIPPSSCILQNSLFQILHENVEFAANVSDNSRGWFDDLHRLLVWFNKLGRRYQEDAVLIVDWIWL